MEEWKSESANCFINIFRQAPKHIAVIMDGNRRFGKQTHSDPLQVRSVVIKMLQTLIFVTLIGSLGWRTAISGFCPMVYARTYLYLNSICIL